MSYGNPEHQHRWQWVKREPPTFMGTGVFMFGKEMMKKKLGRLVRKYVCRDCGAEDR